MSFKINSIFSKIQEFNGLYESLEAEKPPTPDAPLNTVEAKISIFKQQYTKIQQLSTDISSLYNQQSDDFSTFQQNVVVINELSKAHLNAWQDLRPTVLLNKYIELTALAKESSSANYLVILGLKELLTHLETALKDEQITDDQKKSLNALQAQIEETLDTERKKPQPQAPGLDKIFSDIFLSIARELDPVSLNALACSNKHLNAFANRYRQPTLDAPNTTLSEAEIAEARILKREEFGLERAARKSLFFQKLTRSQDLSASEALRTLVLKQKNDRVISIQQIFTEQGLEIWDLLTNSSIKAIVPWGCRDVELTDDAAFLLYNTKIEDGWDTSIKVYDIKHKHLKEEKNITIDFESSESTKLIKFSKLIVCEDKIFIFPDSESQIRINKKPIIIYDLKSNTSRTLWLPPFNFNECKDFVMKDNRAVLLTNNHVHCFDINDKSLSLQSIDLHPTRFSSEDLIKMEVKTDCILLFTIRQKQPRVLSINKESGKISEITYKIPKELDGIPISFSKEGLLTRTMTGAFRSSFRLNFYPYITPTSTIVKNLRFLMEAVANHQSGEKFDLHSLKERFPDCIDDMIAALTEIESSAHASNLTDDQKVEQAIYRFVLKEVVSALEAGYTKEALAFFETLPEAIRKDVYGKLYSIIKADLKYDYWGVGEHVFLRQPHQGTTNANRIQALQMHLASQIEKQ